MLQQFQCHVAGGEVLVYGGVGLQVALYVADAVLYLVSVVDVQVAGGLVGVFVDLYDGLEQVFHAFAALERGGHHRHAEQGGENLAVHVVAAALKLVVHVQGAHHAQVHVQKLGGQIEVALNVRRVHHVDDHVGRLFRQVLAHIQFLGRVAGEGVGARQVGQVELVAVHRGVCFRGVHRDARVVAHMPVGTAGEVEERRLAAVGVAYQCHVDGAALLQGCVLHVVVGVVGFYERRLYRRLEVGLVRLFLGYHLNHFCLLPTQRHLVAHELVLHGVLQRGVEQHLYRLALDEAHLDDSLAESAVS